MRGILRLSLENFKRTRRTYLSAIITITAAVVLIIFFMALYNGALYIVENEIEHNYELREITVYSEASSDSEGSQALLSEDDLATLVDTGETDSITVQYRNDLIDEMYVGGVSVASPDYLIGIDTAYDTFSTAEYELYTEEYPIIAGRDFGEGDTGCALISLTSALCYGCENPEDILGLEIRAESGGSVYTAQIVGVYLDYAAAVYEEEDYSPMYDDAGLLVIESESVLLTADVVSAMNSSAGTDYNEIIISAADAMGAVEIYQYLTEHFSNVVICEMEEIDSVIEYLKLFSRIFALSGAILLLTALLNLFSSIVMVTEEKRKWHCVQKIMGFTNRQLSLCYTFEILRLLAGALASGLIISCVLCFAANKVIVNTLDMELYVSFIFYPSLKYVIALAALLVLFAVLIAFVALRKVKRLNPVEMLREQEA